MHEMDHVSKRPGKPGIFASKKSVRRGYRDETGTALVEFTLVFVFLFMPFMTSVIALSWFLNDYLELTNAVNLGAAQLAVSRGATTDPCLTVEQTVYKVAPMLSPAKLTFTYTFTSNTGTVLGTFNGGGIGGALDVSGCGATGTSGASDAMQQGATVNVYGTYACPSPFGGFGLGWVNNWANHGAGCHMTAEITQVIQ